MKQLEFIVSITLLVPDDTDPEQTYFGNFAEVRCTPNSQLVNMETQEVIEVEES